MDISRAEAGLPALVEHMESLGYSGGYVACVARTVEWLVEHAHEFDGWEDAAAANDERWSATSTKATGRCHLEIVRRFNDEGVLPRTASFQARPRKKARDGLCRGFSAVCEAYETSPAALAKKKATVRGELSNAASFLARIQALGPSCPADVTEDDVLEVLTDDSGGPAFSTSHVKQVRAVLTGAGRIDGCARLASLLPMPRKWRKIGDALSEEERGKVRDALDDPGAALRQRDRAIGCLLFYTGMRACDIAGLRLDEIDWERDEIYLPAQQKTGERLRLPLAAQVGNAIFDYVTGERGASPCPMVFLSLEWPFERLGASSIGDVAGRVLDAAGVRCGPGDRRGSHLFRRTLATAMMGNGVDRSVIAATLGHVSPSSAETYMLADIEGLRRRTLDVSRFSGGEAALA